MLYIVNIQKTTINASTPNQRISNAEVNIVDAINQTEAESKLTQHYVDLNTVEVSYEISILSFNQLIS
jgi:hypothetical protein